MISSAITIATTLIAIALAMEGPSSTCHAFATFGRRQLSRSVGEFDDVIKATERRKHARKHKSSSSSSSSLSLFPDDHIDERYEAAREEFEKLFTTNQNFFDTRDVNGKNDNASVKSDNAPPPPQQQQLGSLSPTTTATATNVKPLTASSRRLKEVELQLLQDLTDSDDTLDPLVELWSRERADAAEELKAMETSCSPGLYKEERQLRRMIDRYGTDWVEPMARLALLLFTKGSFTGLDEAKDLCQTVLTVKPWHFESAQLLVAILLRRGDFQQAVKITRNYCLPQLNERTGHKRRRRWVERSLTFAREALVRAQSVTTLAHQDDAVDELCDIETEGEFCWQ
mmetsp:Transcript_32071/g.78119  ORF Transcript_32071/g.78119 Transcript_32071/m.78119 type:complete len:342 (+) Transcript_32071:121-1146(+)